MSESYPIKSAEQIRQEFAGRKAVLGDGTPLLGFGLMRLPQKDGASDVEQVKRMVDLFMEDGFTYFDTARAYGDSEATIKAALVDRYPRESYTLTTKLAAWLGARSAEDAHRMFQTSLENTGAGYFDLYLLHNLGQERVKVFDEWKLWDFVKDLKGQGLVKHIGFSCHDKAPFLDRILTEHPEMEYVQLQINYADWDDPVVQSRACYETVLAHGKKVIIMEPVKGGTLASLPDTISAPMKEADPHASLASWAIRYAASLPNVLTVLSGMSSVAQMEDSLSFMRDFHPLSPNEQTVVEKVRTAMAAIPHIPCTDCRYCMKGCPKHIAIPGSFSAYNNYLMYGDLDRAKHGYQWSTSGEGFGKASDCVKCGACEKACPQSINIREELAKVAATLE